MANGTSAYIQKLISFQLIHQSYWSVYVFCPQLIALQRTKKHLQYQNLKLSDTMEHFKNEFKK